MKRSILFTFAIFLIGSFMLAAPSAQAQDMKIGFVDPRVILERMPEMRAVQQRLQNFAERKQREISDAERALQTEIELYQQKVGVISEQARRNEEERLGEMDLELRQLQNQAQQELQQRRAELMAPLLEQIQNAINEVAGAKNIDYVLNTTTSTGDVIILYVKDEIRNDYDITEAVMVNLGI
ncbi:MAG: OmpH family outer membrane protein [Balneolaceae bacterium]